MQAVTKTPPRLRQSTHTRAVCVHVCAAGIREHRLVAGFVFTLLLQVGVPVILNSIVGSTERRERAMRSRDTHSEV